MGGSGLDRRLGLGHTLGRGLPTITTCSRGTPPPRIGRATGFRPLCVLLASCHPQDPVGASPKNSCSGWEPRWRSSVMNSTICLRTMFPRGFGIAVHICKVSCSVARHALNRRHDAIHAASRGSAPIGPGRCPLGAGDGRWSIWYSVWSMSTGRSWSDFNAERGGWLTLRHRLPSRIVGSHGIVTSIEPIRTQSSAYHSIWH
jgi:hypothetical protein